MDPMIKNSFSPMLICWNDIKIHLGFEDSYFVPPPTIMSQRIILCCLLYNPALVQLSHNDKLEDKKFLKLKLLLHTRL